MTPKVSIILAAWNAENFLKRSLDSIVGQTFHDFELVLVDDGSTDGTGAIADSYASEDSRIKVIHQKHGGLAKARQTGLDAAKGVFSIFADADDSLEPDMVELLYNEAVRTSSDIVFCDYIEENRQGIFHRRQQPAGRCSRAVLSQMWEYMHGSLCTKLIRRSLYEEFGVRFVPGISFCDDECVVIPILFHDVAVSYVGKGLYHYDKNANLCSDSNVWRNRKTAEYQAYLDRIEPYFKDAGLERKFLDRVAFIINRLTYAPKDNYADNRLFYQRYCQALKGSSLTFSKKLFCILYFNGFRFLAGIRELFIK
ncbi:MAG: glycosyltransferase [Bacteroidales bacterium]|nr:glycosyltransferase [Bacteroidales bacterium]